MEELQKLYNAISSKFDIGSLSEFTNKMQTPDDRKRFYDVVNSKGFDLGEYDAYENRLKKKEDSESTATDQKLVSEAKVEDGSSDTQEDDRAPLPDNPINDSEIDAKTPLEDLIKEKALYNSKNTHLAGRAGMNHAQAQRWKKLGYRINKRQETDSSSDTQEVEQAEVGKLEKQNLGIDRKTSVVLEEGSDPSTVKMMHRGNNKNENGKYTSFPSIFPKDPNNQTSDPNDWIVARNEDHAYELAKERGEVLEYDTAEEAQAVAEGSWKKDNRGQLVKDIDAGKFDDDEAIDLEVTSEKKKKLAEIQSLSDRHDQKRNNEEDIQDTKDQIEAEKRGDFGFLGGISDGWNKTMNGIKSTSIFQIFDFEKSKSKLEEQQEDITKIQKELASQQGVEDYNEISYDEAKDAYWANREYELLRSKGDNRIREFNEELTNQDRQDLALHFEINEFNLKAESLDKQLNMEKLMIKRSDLSSELTKVQKEMSSLNDEYNGAESVPPEVLKKAKELDSRQKELLTDINLIPLAISDMWSEYNEIEEDISETKNEVDLYRRNYNDVVNIFGKLGLSTIEFGTNLDEFISKYSLQRKAADEILNLVGYDLEANKKEEREALRGFVEKGRKSLRRPIELEDIGFNNGVDWAFDLGAEQAINVVVMATTGGAALPLVGMSSAGSKVYDMDQDEKHSLGAIKYSEAEKLFVPILFGVAEAASEKISIGQINKMKRIFRSVKGITLKRSVQSYLVDNYKDYFKDMIEEGGSEAVSQLAQNITDKYLLGKDISITDGLSEAFVSGAFMSAVMFKMPVLFKDMYNGVISKDTNQKLGEISHELLSLSKELKTEGISETSRNRIIQAQNKLVHDQGRLLEEEMGKLDGLDSDSKKDILDIHTKKYKLREEYDKVNRDTKISDKSRKKLLEGIVSEVKELEGKKADILGVKKQFEALNIKDKQKYKDQAMSALEAEAKAEGKTEYSFNDAQITERANQIYQNAKTETTTEQEAKPKVETTAPSTETKQEDVKPTENAVTPQKIEAKVNEIKERNAISYAEANKQATEELSKDANGAISPQAIKERTAQIQEESKNKGTNEGAVYQQAIKEIEKELPVTLPVTSTTAPASTNDNLVTKERIDSKVDEIKKRGEISEAEAYKQASDELSKNNKGILTTDKIKARAEEIKKENSTEGKSESEIYKQALKEIETEIQDITNEAQKKGDTKPNADVQPSTKPSVSKGKDNAVQSTTEPKASKGEVEVKTEAKAEESRGDTLKVGDTFTKRIPGEGTVTFTVTRPLSKNKGENNYSLMAVVVNSTGKGGGFYKQNQGKEMPVWFEKKNGKFGRVKVKAQESTTRTETDSKAEKTEEEEMAEIERLMEERDKPTKEQKESRRAEELKIKAKEKNKEKSLSKKSSRNRRIIKQVQNARKSISKIVGNVEIVVFGSESEYFEATGSRSRGFYSPAQKNKPAKIYINLAKASRTTVAHEVFHAVLLSKFNSAKRVKEVTGKMISELGEALEGRKGLEELLEKVRLFGDLYKEEDVVDEEALAEFVGYLAELYSSDIGRVKAAIKNWIRAIAEMFSLDTSIKTENDVFNLLDTIARKTATGEVLTEADIETISNLKEEGFSKRSNIKRRNQALDANPVISQSNSSNFANMTEDGKGNFVFFHIGNDGYKTIKPATGNSTITSKEESSALAKVGGLAMYYTNNHYSERQSSNGAKYAITVAKEKVYDFNTDKLNLIEEAKENHKKEHPYQAFDFNTQVAYVTQIANKKGYDMVVAEWGKSTRAQTTTELKPSDKSTSEGSKVVKSFSNKYTSNQEKGFNSIIPKSKSELLSKVYDDIHMIKNRGGVYDSLYFLYDLHDKYTQAEITKMIFESDLPESAKTKYASIINKKIGYRRSEKSEASNDNIKERNQIPAIEIYKLSEAQDNRSIKELGALLNSFSGGETTLKDGKKALIAKFLENIYEEVHHALASKENARDAGVTWYAEDMQEFAQKIKIIFSELKNPLEHKLFLSILAVTSSGTNPNENLAYTYNLWNNSSSPKDFEFSKNWGEEKMSFISDKAKPLGSGRIVKETKYHWSFQEADAFGKLKYFKNGKPVIRRVLKSKLKKGYPKPTGYTARGEIVVSQLEKIEKLSEKLGSLEAVIEWLETPHSIQELREYNIGVPDVNGASAGKTNKKYDPSKNAVGERNGAFIFGEKIGSFYQNMIGIGEHITMDLWWSRTWNRYMGTMLSKVEIMKKKKGTGKFKEVLQETPRSDEERNIMREAVDIASKKLGLEPSELQAIIWYFEQELWTKAGNRSPSYSYVTAINSLTNKIDIDATTRKRIKESEVDLSQAQKRTENAKLRAGRNSNEKSYRNSPTQGDQVAGRAQKAGVGVAPALSTAINNISEVESALSKNNYGKDLVNTIKRAADALGVKILNNHSSAGGWYSSDISKTIKEASKRIEVKYKNKKQLNAFASFLGVLAPEMQEGVYVAEYTTKGKDVEHGFVFDSDKNAEIVIEKLNEFGLGDGFSYDTVTKTLYIGDLGNNNFDKIEKLYKFAINYGLKEHKSEKATISFPSSSSYGGSLQEYGNSLLPESEERGRGFNTLYKEAQERLANDTPTVRKQKTWKSTAQEGVAQVQQKSATPEQWVKMITDKGGKGTSQELSWIGLLDFLKDFIKSNKAKSVPKDTVEQYIKDNQIEIKEVTKGGNGIKTYTPENYEEFPQEVTDVFEEFEDDEFEIATGLERLGYDVVREMDGTIIRFSKDETQGPSNLQETKYSSYTLEGGENYREVLLTLPNKKPSELVVEKRNELNFEINNLQIQRNKEGVTKSEKLAIDDKIDKLQLEELNLSEKFYKDVKSNYKSSHWDESNILAHVRLNERTLPNGESVLFIEEVQSDWAQDGKKRGFKNPITVKMGEIPDGAFVEKRGLGFGLVLEDGTKLSTQETESEARDMYYVNKKYDQDVSLPNMPYKKTDQWVGMAMRRVMQMASNEGFDRIAWVTGEQSAERYDLSKSVDDIRYIKNEDGSFQINAFQRGGNVFSKNNMNEQDISDTLGKEIAEKIVNGVGEKIENETSISGEGLKVGGEGMKTFYNSILPKVAKKEAQRFDKKAKVDVIGLNTTNFAEENYYKLPKKVQNIITKYDTDIDFDKKSTLDKRKERFIKEMEAEGYTAEFNSDYRATGIFAESKQLSIKLTSKMDEALDQPIARFQKASNDTTNEIEATKKYLRDKGISQKSVDKYIEDKYGKKDSKPKNKTAEPKTKKSNSKERRYSNRSLKEYANNNTIVEAINEAGTEYEVQKWKKVNPIADAIVDKAKNSEDPNKAFDSIKEQIKNTTNDDYVNNPIMLATLHALVAHKVLDHFRRVGEIQKFSEFNLYFASMGTTRGQFISAMQNSSAPEAIVNSAMESILAEKADKIGNNDQEIEDLRVWVNSLQEELVNKELESAELQKKIEELLTKATKTNTHTTANQNKSKTQQAKDLAKKVRSYKVSSDRYSFSQIIPITPVVNGALETVASAIEAGATVAEAIQKALKEIRKTKEYKSYQSHQQQKIEDLFVEDVERITTDKVYTNTDIETIIKRHYAKENRGETLASILIHELNISPEIANEIEETLTKRIETKLEAKLRQKFNLDTEGNVKEKKAIVRKTEVDSIIEAVKYGAMEKDMFANHFGDLFGFPALKPEHLAKIEELVGYIFKYNGSEMSYRYKKELADYVSAMRPRTSKKFYNILYSLTIRASLTGVNTNTVNIPIGSLFSYSFNQVPKFAMNPRAWLKARKAWKEAGLSGMGRQSFTDIYKSGFNMLDLQGSKFDERGVADGDTVDYWLSQKPSDVFKSHKNPIKGTVALAVLSFLKIFKIANFARAFDAIMNHKGSEMTQYINEYNDVAKELKMKGLPRSASQIAKIVEENLGYSRISGIQAQVNQEVQDIKNTNGKVPNGYKKRRIKEIMEEGRNPDKVKEAMDWVKYSTLMNDPDGLLGGVYKMFNKTSKINAEKQSGVDGGGKYVTDGFKFLFHVSVGLFLRIGVTSSQAILRNIPAVGLSSVLFGRLQNVEVDGRKVMKWKRLPARKVKARLVEHAITTSLLAAAFFSMFSWDDEEEEFKLKEDRLIDIVGMGTGKWQDNEQLNQTDSGGVDERKNLMIRVKIGGDWVDVIPARLFPQLLPLVSIVGGLRDKSVIEKTKLNKEEATTLLKEGIWDIIGSTTELSFNSLPQAVSSFMYATMKKDEDVLSAVGESLTKTMVRPLKTTVQPNIIRDAYYEILSLNESGKRTGTPLTNSLVSNFYGLEYFNYGGNMTDRVDMFGYEIKHTSSVKNALNNLPFIEFKKNNNWRFEEPSWQVHNAHPGVVIKTHWATGKSYKQKLVEAKIWGEWMRKVTEANAEELINMSDEDYEVRMKEYSTKAKYQIKESADKKKREWFEKNGDRLSKMTPKEFDKEMKKYDDKSN